MPQDYTFFERNRLVGKLWHAPETLIIRLPSPLGRAPFRHHHPRHRDPRRLPRPVVLYVQTLPTHVVLHASLASRPTVSFFLSFSSAIVSPLCR